MAALGLLIAQAGDPEVNAQAANQPVSGAAILWRSALSVEAEGRVGVKGTEEDSRKQQERGPRQRAYNSSYPGIVVAGGDSMNAETRQVRACGGVAGRGGPLGLIALCVVLLSGLAWGCFGSPATTLDFAASVREGNFPLAVGFTSTVPGNTTSWEWRFGDGTSSGDRNPTHTYSSPGVYTVRLRITIGLPSGVEGTRTKTKVDYITVGPRKLYVEHSPLHSPGAMDNVAVSVVNAVGDIAMGMFMVDPDPFPAVFKGGKAYMPSYCDGSDHGFVSVIDTSTDSLQKAIAVGKGPRAVAIAGSRAYVANFLSQSVSVIDTSTNSFVWTIEVQSGPRCIAFSGSRAYVANYGSNSVSVINTQGGWVTKTILVGEGPRNILVFGGKAYVVNYGHDGARGSVSVIDTQSSDVVATIQVGSLPRAIAASGSKVYVVNSCGDGVAAHGTVTVINTTTLSVATTIPVGDLPWDIVICGNRAYVPNYAGNGGNLEHGTVSVISLGSNTVVDTISVGAGPVALAIIGHKGYVSNYLSAGPGAITVFSTDTNDVIATIDLAAAAPAFLAAVP